MKNNVIRVNNVIMHNSFVKNSLMKNIITKSTVRTGVMACLLASTTAHGAIVRPLDEMKVLEVPIAQDALTRIKIQDDRILHVFGNAGDYVLETDDEQGQIFIHPTPQASFEGVGSKSISLTLTTETGYTQDLRLFPKNQAPETLILQINMDLDQELEKDSFNESSFNKNSFNEKRLSSSPLFREEIEELILACRENRIPLGYKEVPLSLETLQGPYLLTRAIQGQKLRGLTYRVQNNTKEPLVLSEEEIANRLLSLDHTNTSGEEGFNTVVALSIVKKTLTPGEETDVYVAARIH